MGNPSFELARGVEVGGGSPLVFLAGPCSLESREMALHTAGELARIASRLGAPLVFKASFDKANRSSASGLRGLGMEEGLKVLAEISRDLGLPVLTDVHETSQVEAVASVVDVLQVPAFLCRQTDLLLACGATGKAVNVKKGPFLAASDMAGAVEKVRSGGSPRVLVTERGTSFGYHDLVVDLRGLVVMGELDCALVYDATHSVQRPGALGQQSGGDRRFLMPLLKAALAVGVDAVFLEVHPDPASAISDGATQVPLAQTEAVMELALAMDRARRSLPRSPLLS